MSRLGEDACVVAERSERVGEVVDGVLDVCGVDRAADQDTEWFGGCALLERGAPGEGLLRVCGCSGGGDQHRCVGLLARGAVGEHARGTVTEAEGPLIVGQGERLFRQGVIDAVDQPVAEAIEGAECDEPFGCFVGDGMCQVGRGE